WASARRKTAQAVEQFWQASTPDEAAHTLSHRIPDTSFSNLALQAISAANHFDAHHGKAIGDSDRSEFLTRALRQSIVRSTARLESGLTMLASIGSIAPFV